MSIQEVFASAAELSLEERWQVVDGLLEELDNQANPGIKQVWLEECNRREAALAKGKTKTLDGLEVLQSLRQRSR